MSKAVELGAAKLVFATILLVTLGAITSRAAAACISEPVSFGAFAYDEVLVSGSNGALSDRSAAKALNEANGMNLAARECGRALEALKQEYRLPNNFHGRIASSGDYLDEAGKVIDNILGYLP
jgi:hypothetical protein